MPGIYGSVNFIVGKPSHQKPTQMEPCVVCGKDCYRQTYQRGGEGWVWRHIGCDPHQAHIERRYTRSGAAQGYVPSTYEHGEGGGSRFDPRLAQAIRQSRRS